MTYFISIRGRKRGGPNKMSNFKDAQHINFNYFYGYLSFGTTFFISVRFKCDFRFN